MGDRTTVNITLRRNDFLLHEEFLRSKDVGAHVDDESNDNTVSLQGDEVNYGEWDEVEKFLKDNEIEYDKSWDSGGNYESGNAYFRKINGEYTSYEIYATQESILEVLIELQELLEKDPKKGLKEIKKRIKKLHPFDAVNLNQPNVSRFIKEA